MTIQSTAPRVSALVGKTLDAGRLKLVKVLGEGAYGVVYLAVEQLEASSGSSSKTCPREFAVKALRKADSDSLVGQCQSREIVAHKIVSDHPGVLTLHNVLEDDWFIFLVLDYCPGGDLYSMIVERHTFAQKDALIKSVFVQILDAVQSCHDKGIYHRDLKPDNVFVSADGSKVYLGDFGLATDQAISTNHSYGSSFYMSPECIGEEHKFSPYSTEISDIWSLGVIFVNMITGRNPWRWAITDDEHFHRYMSDPDKFIANLLPMSAPTSELLKRVFTFNPVSRISLEEFREAVLAINTFFPSAPEVDSAVRDKRVVDTPASAIPSHATPQLPQGVAEDFSKMHAYPDEEYLFSSPDPNTSYTPPSSTSSTPSTILSPTSTLCDDDDDVFAKGCHIKLGEMDEMLEEDSHSARVYPLKHANNPMGAAMRMLERLVL